MGIMNGRASGIGPPSQVYRSLDDIPTWDTRVPGTEPPGRIGRRLLADGPDRAQISHRRDRSLSPTSSEIDALEESFCDFSLEPSQVEGDSSQSSYNDMQTTTTLTSLSSRTVASSTGYTDLLQPLSDLVSGSGASKLMPLGARLRLVWRKSPALLSSHVLF